MAWNLVEGRARGVPDAIWIDERFGSVQPIAAAWLSPLGGATPRNIHVVLVTCIVAALCVTAGAFTCPATFVTWLAFDACVSRPKRTFSFCCYIARV